ncbi:type II toxin-antitoxin system RelE/ParE family toxin [Desulfobacter postgatei]|uniref:type II toxin-antitoxin system RelE/ParE family toxin n=1 Tax=Desulfobacter postgatei TaxID=2293 RepID=UPI00259B1E72|nr:type II toxin-antitoxin system RelE/ParE family toxin [uncultured Desulfobacter sp.]
MKEITFIGSSLKDLKSFPAPAKQRAGHELMAVQMNIDPTDWKPMNTVGPGVKEIRIHEGGEFRVLYVAKFAEAVFVLHAFQKKTQKTPKKEIDLAKSRLKQLQQERNMP